MKRVCITYHMRKQIGNPSDHRFESAENCITTSVTKKIADELLHGNVPSKIHNFLECLARIQGYQRAEFCMAEIEE